MKPGDVVIGLLPGVVETKARPAVVIASGEYLRDRPDAILGTVTTRIPARRVSIQRKAAVNGVLFVDSVG